MWELFLPIKGLVAGHGGVVDQAVAALDVAAEVVELAALGSSGQPQA